MTSSILVVASVLACAQACYWNAECPYLLYATKTPYDTVRGDIRDQKLPQNCEAISVWSLHRHGTKNPVEQEIGRIKSILSLKDEILESHDAGRGELCAQDLENFRQWSWDVSLEDSISLLVGKGYEEIFNIGKRIRQRYPHLLHGSPEDFYFKAANLHWLIATADAFVHGLTDGTNLTLFIDVAKTLNDFLTPNENCDRYQNEVASSQLLNDQLENYTRNAEFVAVQRAVQQRLGITTQLTPKHINGIYELCRFDRSWSKIYQSPWCAAFSDQDLVLLEYRDDVRHYYRYGYGSWVNLKLGGILLKDLYENFEASVQGRGRKVTSYFTHKSILEMVWCAMGLFKDPVPLQALHRNSSRVWRTSITGAYSVNLIAVLNRCQESGRQTFRVQFYINEKETEICPRDGCTWQQFQEKFQRFASANLDFCSMEYRGPELEEDNVASAV